MKNITKTLTLVVLAMLLTATLSVQVNAQKKGISITSETAINGSISDVFTLLSQLERYPEWSPFLVTDPQQKHHVTGVNGEVGSTYHWEGVAEKSKGYQTLASMVPNQSLRMECTMLKPFKGNPVFDYSLVQDGQTVKVVQHFDLKMNGFSKLMAGLFGVKKQMTKVNQLGLERLKKLCEQNQVAKN